MAYLPTHLVRTLANSQMNRAKVYSPSRLLNEHRDRSNRMSSFDIFLSHAKEDETIVLGVVGVLELLGHSVYVDWIVDQQLDRSRVTAGHADILRRRMQSCRCMLYLTTQSSASSVWMPWELGYFDGRKPGQIAILPVLEAGSSFKGQEFLGLYPAVEYDRLPGRASPDLFTREIGKPARLLSEMVRASG